MVSERGYKKARTLEEAIAELLRCRDTHFDPELVQAFLRSLETYGDPRDNTVWDHEDNSALVEIAEWVSEANAGGPASIAGTADAAASCVEGSGVLPDGTLACASQLLTSGLPRHAPTCSTYPVPARSWL